MDTTIEPLLDVNDVARILKMSRTTVYRLVADEPPPTVEIRLQKKTGDRKSGRVMKTRFRRSDIAALIGEGGFDE